MEQIERAFINPSDDYTPFPFWFWNDELSKEEITRQLHGFRDKGVAGFVLHPRIGLPIDVPYLSEAYFGFVRHAVAEADKLGMKVVLYDEAMYPSGSAHGRVVQDYPEFASRGLRMQKISVAEAASGGPSLASGERVLSVQIVRFTSEGSIDPKSIQILEQTDIAAALRLFLSEEWYLIFFIEGASGGTIRGIHFGEDDHELNAPASADLLNPDAVQVFISLTHERYYAELGNYFGHTITAIFTDEPDLLGRCASPEYKPWTSDFMEAFLKAGGKETDLPLLWLDSGDASKSVQQMYNEAIHNRMSEAYYAPIAAWCASHHIALTGHPQKSDDIGYLQHFQIPGQDLVWRWVAPEEKKGITGEHSTLGKCASDAARHAGKRRNANECFGCCGPDENQWAFSADDMKWYLDWLFVRGVNMVFPHAFYYSVRGEKRYGERPPDVGPNNNWWPYYQLISTYMKRMCWLMTDSVNQAEVALLCGEDDLPWQTPMHLFERQIEFNYLEISYLLTGRFQVEGGVLCIQKQRYRLLVVEDATLISDALQQALKPFLSEGGHLLVLQQDVQPKPITGAITASSIHRMVRGIEALASVSVSLDPKFQEIRVSYVIKEKHHFFVFVNEGENTFRGNCQFPITGLAEIWDAWRGTITAVSLDESSLPLVIGRRESLIVRIDPSGNPAGNCSTVENGRTNRELDLMKPIGQKQDIHLENLPANIKLPDEGWRIKRDGNACLPETALGSWTNWLGWDDFAGTLSYEISFEVPEASKPHTVKAHVLLDLGEVYEIAQLFVNGNEAGVRMWAPYVFDITELIHTGRNVLRIDVSNSMANRYSQQKRHSGLLGPVMIRFVD